MKKLNDPLELETERVLDRDPQIPHSSQKSTPITEFLKRNSELFAIIGIFAAVTTSVPRILPDGHSATTYAVLGGVSLFSLTAVILFQQLVAEASSASSDGKVLRSVWYFASILSFLGLAFAVFQAAVARQQTAEPMIDTAGSILMVFAYSTMISNYEAPSEGLHSALEKVIQKSWLFALVFLVPISSQVELNLLQPPYYVGMFRAILLHGVLFIWVILFIRGANTLLSIIEEMWPKFELIRE